MQHNRRILRLILWGLVIALLISIYLLSSQPASSSAKLSTNIAEHTIHIYEKLTGMDITIKQWDHKLRKAAHFSIYSLLGIFIMTLCLISGVSKKWSILITMVVGIIYASIDELHQLFVDGRGASVRDVGIDSLGVILGITIIWIVNRRWKR
ncbi:VanZ family protein [Paenibacillus endoradicis]|uniref:VanZ family protein n=1 Tax=Paenibacillus endoradicis TaxID=2972487 RepID=UPI002158CD50|nr:VanZ family protein [Paenibacillus endoradicis]MCR8660664.1 VanZ family protein [Paenibacillus endoradicis]